MKPGTCKTCRHWRIGRIVTVLPTFCEGIVGTTFVPDIPDRDLPDFGWCQQLEDNREVAEAMAFSSGYDVPHTFCCKADFGCVLHEPLTDPTDQYVEETFE